MKPNSDLPNDDSDLAASSLSNESDHLSELKDEISQPKINVRPLNKKDLIKLKTIRQLELSQLRRTSQIIRNQEFKDQ